MGEYRRGAHTVFEIHLHLVWITKYRRAALKGEVATRTRDLIRDICGQHEVKILKGHVSKDHVHLFLSIPPQVTISRLLQWLKGKTAHHLMVEFPLEEAVLGTTSVGPWVFLLQLTRIGSRPNSTLVRPWRSWMAARVGPCPRRQIA